MSKSVWSHFLLLLQIYLMQEQNKDCIEHEQLSSVFSYMVLLGTIRASGHMIMIMIMAKCSGVLCSYSMFCSCVWLQIDCCVYLKSSKIEWSLTVLSSSTTQMLYIISRYICKPTAYSQPQLPYLSPYLFILLPSSYLYAHSFVSDMTITSATD